MSTISKTVILIITLLCSLTTYAQESLLNNLDNKNGFNNLKLKSTFNEVKKLVSLKKVNETKVKNGKMEYYSIKNANETYTFGSYKVKSISLGFFNSNELQINVLAFIEVNLADSRFLRDSDQLNEMLKKEYGLPTNSSSSDDSFELRQNQIAYTLDWQGEKVFLRMTRWSAPVNERFEFLGNTYRYYDIGILNFTNERANNGF
ncbi:hypothetical protein VRU48_08085 [Pedobacter sp. KR3-3]|uniref:Uncharacterized protein n=1 Tax=Pedobacter albus TaxID=3113905 RepID=A0ABU7I6H3_9SPHI|nr:hypothetical protein [Pedobacter sp. KR3-3]MEE1945062.1 hypothetical protein [Pedobacter sp. KR3-3]